MTSTAGSPRHRRKPRDPVHPHGWRRASDVATPVVSTTEGNRSRAPAGTSLLLALLVVVLAAVGIVRVQTTTQVLELGAEIADLTAEHGRLQDEKRRLSAERAYLRHPDQIEQAARDRLGLVPIAPELIQEVRLVTERPILKTTEE